MDKPKVRGSSPYSDKGVTESEVNGFRDLEGVEDLYVLEDACSFTDSVATEFY